MTLVCVWEQKDGYKSCPVCGRRYYGQAENPSAICGGHKVHGPTLRAGINVPVRFQQQETPATFADQLKQVFAQSTTTSTTSKKKGCGGCGQLTPEQRAALIEWRKQKRKKKVE